MRVDQISKPIRIAAPSDDPAAIQRRASEALTSRAIKGELVPDARAFQLLSLKDHARAALDHAAARAVTRFCAAP